MNMSTSKIYSCTMSSATSSKNYSWFGSGRCRSQCTHRVTEFHLLERDAADGSRLTLDNQLLTISLREIETTVRRHQSRELSDRAFIRDSANSFRNYQYNSQSSFFYAPLWSSRWFIRIYYKMKLVEARSTLKLRDFCSCFFGVASDYWPWPISMASVTRITWIFTRGRRQRQCSSKWTRRWRWTILSWLLMFIENLRDEFECTQDSSIEERRDKLPVDSRSKRSSLLVFLACPLPLSSVHCCSQLAWGEFEFAPEWAVSTKATRNGSTNISCRCPAGRHNRFHFYWLAEMPVRKSTHWSFCGTDSRDSCRASDRSLKWFDWLPVECDWFPYKLTKGCYSLAHDWREPRRSHPMTTPSGNGRRPLVFGRLDRVVARHLLRRYQPSVAHVFEMNAFESVILTCISALVRGFTTPYDRLTSVSCSRKYM